MRATAVLFAALTVPLWAQMTIEIRGAYSDPKPFWKTGARLDEYGVNAVFVHGGGITPELLARAKAEGARVYSEFATLNGKGYVEKHPEAWPINEKGEREGPATWFQGVCPTEPGFRAYRLKQLAETLEKHDISGVWLDYFHWHAQFEDPNPILPETCFSPTCLAAFSKATGLKLPDGTTAEKARWILTKHEKQWRDWRCSVLVDWAREFRKVIREKRPGALLGIYHCPWTDEEFSGARRRVLGLDFDLLKNEVDAFSPMVYHGRMGRPASWVGEYIEWFSKRLGLHRGQSPKVWPIVQAHNEPNVISAQEFEQVMRHGLSGASTGVMMFTFSSVASDPAKMAAMKKIYTGGGR